MCIATIFSKAKLNTLFSVQYLAEGNVRLVSVATSGTPSSSIRLYSYGVADPGHSDKHEIKTVGKFDTVGTA